MPTGQLLHLLDTIRLPFHDLSLAPCLPFRLDLDLLPLVCPTCCAAALRYPPSWLPKTRSTRRFAPSPLFLFLHLALYAVSATDLLRNPQYSSNGPLMEMCYNRSVPGQL